MDIFSLAVLAGVIEEIVPDYSYLTKTYFPATQQEVSDKITFDVRKRGRRLAPFVSPLVQGQIVEKTGFRTQTIAPAYVKDKRVFDPNTPFRRAFGEKIGGALTPQQRLDAALTAESKDQIDMINNRIEVMCGEVLTTGKLTIVGELYPQVIVDFGRDASLTVALTGSAEWGDVGVDPLASLAAWANLMFLQSGVRPVNVTMTPDAYALFAASTSVVKILDRVRAANTFQGNAIEGDDGWFAGNIGGFNISVYNGTYIDPISNASRNVLPAYTVIMAHSQMQGYRVFGAIKDEAAGLQALPYFQKSWTVEDPAVRYLMLQSAPLVVPHIPDASLCATVKVAS